MGFFVAIVWIMAIADEVVNVLKVSLDISHHQVSAHIHFSGFRLHFWPFRRHHWPHHLCHGKFPGGSRGEHERGGL